MNNGLWLTFGLGAPVGMEGVLLTCPCSELISGDEFICLCSSLKALLHPDERVTAIFVAEHVSINVQFT